MKRLFVLSVILLTGCASIIDSLGPSGPPPKYFESLEDFKLCLWFYDSEQANSTGTEWGLWRSEEWRIEQYKKMENELKRRNLVCSEKFPSWDEFKGKSELDLLLEQGN
jgi:hypothetical protein